MTTLFVYNQDSMECVARIEGSTNAYCESMFNDRFGCCDDFAATYGPAFGVDGGLVAGENVEDIDAE
jgi:hypothetical protein